MKKVPLLLFIFVFLSGCGVVVDTQNSSSKSDVKTVEITSETSVGGNELRSEKKIIRTGELILKVQSDKDNSYNYDEYYFGGFISGNINTLVINKVVKSGTYSSISMPLYYRSTEGKIIFPNTVASITIVERSIDEGWIEIE